MKKGTEVTLIEDVLIVDNIGHDWLFKGATGEVLEENDDTLTLVINKKSYTDIPLESVIAKDAA